MHRLPWARTWVTLWPTLCKHEHSSLSWCTKIISQEIMEVRDCWDESKHWVHKGVQDTAQMLIYCLGNLLWLRVRHLSVMSRVCVHCSMWQWRNTKYQWVQSCQITNTKGSELALGMQCNKLLEILHRQCWLTKETATHRNQLLSIWVLLWEMEILIIQIFYFLSLYSYRAFAA